MKIGLELGMSGTNVERLQRTLLSAGHEIAHDETERNKFGPSTLAALQEFQSRHGLRRTRQINRATLELLLEVEEHITIDIKEETTPVKPPAPDEHHGRVRGKLVDQDGAAIAKAKVSLFAERIRSERRLGDSTTARHGQYTIAYRRPGALNLLVRAYDHSGKVSAQSATVFAAPAEVEIDLTTASDGVVRSPSLFTTLHSQVAAQLHGTPLGELTENKDTHELTFLANSIGAPFDRVAYLFIGAKLGTANGLQDATFFGLFHQGIPASLNAALASLPDAGIDDTFTAQALSGILAHSRSSLSQALTAAVAANVIPASYAATLAAELSKLDALRTASTGSAPYIGGKTPLNDLLAAGSIPAAVQTAFVQAYADNGGSLGPTWTALRANKNLSKADLAALNTTLSAGELLGGNLPLVKDTLPRLSQGTLTSLQNLALLDQSDWVTRIAALDPQATSIPPVLPNETPQQRIARFSKTLAGRFAARYPTTAFAGGLAKANTASSFTTQAELIPFLGANASLDLQKANLDQYVAAQKVPISLSAAALKELKIAQRLLRISPTHASVEALNKAGYPSAQSIYFKGREAFIAHMTNPPVSPNETPQPAQPWSASLAQTVYARAQVTYATALMAFGRYNLALNGIGFSAMASAVPDAATLTNLPDLQALFGSLDTFQCADCQSVYSPAAYLVDLLQYLSKFKATPAAGSPAPISAVTTALSALLLRRPEIQYIALDCNNTIITHPYIDLVNEILEAVIAPRAVIAITAASNASPIAIGTALPHGLNTGTQVFISGVLGNTAANGTFTITVTGPTAFTLDGSKGNGAWTGGGIVNPVIDTTGTSAERRALPQQISQAAYNLTQGVTFPLSLPFDLPFAQTTAYLGALGTSRAAILTLFAAPLPGTGAAVVACASLGINPEMQSVIHTQDTSDPWTRWGMAQNPSQVINPKTRLPYSPNPGDWVAALNKVPVLLNRAGISLQQLYQLLEVIWVTRSGVTLQLGVDTQGILSPDTDQMTFTGLTGNVLDRANRFLRLWTATGLQMWELDWALGILPIEGALDDSFLVKLAGALAVRKKLHLPFQEVLSFWGPMETRDVTSHLGDEDTVIPSTYSEVFRNPTMLASWSSVFVAAGSLSGTPIIPSQPTPTAAQSANVNAVTAALPLSANDIQAILTFTNTPNALSLPTLNVLLRYARLASSLSLDIPDLILWCQLTAINNPFGRAPVSTIEFLRRLAVLLGTGIAVHDLDYLLRNRSVPQSPLAFTAAQATTVLQTVRDAVAKLPPTVPIAVTAASNASPIAIGTATPHGLKTGTQVLISGVLGNTAANGTFTIAVTGPTAFTLDGSKGNGAWTAGGTVTVDNAPAIQTIFVQALATATGVAANVVTPVLLKTSVLPLGSSTVSALLQETSGVDPTQFPQLVNAFTSVAKAAALFTAVRPSEGEFAFLVQNAASFNWLDPSALPLTATDASPYVALEALLRALKLNRRQAARKPKLFDVLGQWPTTLTVGGTWAAGQVYSFTIVGAGQTIPITYTSVSADKDNAGTAASMSASINASAAVAGSGAFLNAATASAGVISFLARSVESLGYTIVNPAATGTGTLLPATIPADIPADFAFALNASVADVTAIATKLNAKAPSLDATQQLGSLCDMAMLTSIADALDVGARYGIGGAALVQLAAAPATADSAHAAMGAFQRQYAQSAWFAAVQPVEDSLREKRRDALVAYLLGPGASAVPGTTFVTSDDIFDYFLIDPEMSACAVTTRLLQASLAIQQFVQQCFFNLTFQVTVDTTNSNWEEWSWRQQYQLWKANRQVFLYPENYLLPELRKNASPFFSDLESDLRQSNCDADAVESAFENYLRKLVEVSQLVVAAHYNETKPDGSLVLHVFAHTQGTPPKWHYRTRTTMPPASGMWSAWEPLNLDIGFNQLLPVIWDQRLQLVWPIFKQISEQASAQPVPAQGGGQPSPVPQKFWAVEFAMSELSAGQWLPKRTITEKMFFNTSDSKLAFTFQARPDPSFNLQLYVYYNAIAEAIAQAMAAVAPEVAFIKWVTGLGGSVTGSFTSSGSAFSSSATVTLTTDGTSYTVTIGSTSATSGLVANGTLPMPDAPLSAMESSPILPPSPLVDPSQEPTFALVVPTSAISGPPSSLKTPTHYGFSGQDLVFGTYLTTNPGLVQLWVLSQTTANGQPTSVELLGKIFNPRIVVPQQEPVFDSLDPFFVIDGGGGSGTSPRPSRTYLVQPKNYTVSSSPQELESPAYYQQWSTSYAFQTFYYPFARTLLRELEIGGVSKLMSRTLQIDPQSVRGWPTTFNFNEIFSPLSPPVLQPYPGDQNAPDPGETALDFDPSCGGASSQSNWEIFYHAPMFVAALLMQNQRYQDAMTWLEYIFNPTDSSGGPAPQRFWEMAPFYDLNATDWQSQQIGQILTSGIGDSTTLAAIASWMNDPFDPHTVASLRIAAYGKATVMKFLDNLIAWGDSLYSQYTMETVSQAEQLYIVADLILGPKPDQVRMPSSHEAASEAATYASLQNRNLDAFSNALVNVENLVVSPAPPPSLVQGTAATPSLPQFLLFCIPPNAQLLAYWDTVAQRLYNIRHCLNLQGVAQPLPLYAPPVNVLNLIAQQAGGAGAAGGQAFAPVYRFATYLQRALDLTNDVRAYGAHILSALEKKDAEHLAALRANQDLNIQTLILDVKTRQVTEAQDQITALQNQQAIIQIRYDFYKNIKFMNDWEIAAISLQGAALIANGVALVLDIAAGIAHLVPDFTIGVSGFGGTPTVTVTEGGKNAGHSASAWASNWRSIAGILSEGGGMAATMGGYQRRMDEWNLQANLAAAELTQVASQIAAATDRLNIANSELSIQNQQIANAQTVNDFLTAKYTNEQLYDWMLTQLTTVHTQAYQLAVGLALQAQAAFQYELGNSETFIQFGYWDSQHKGLTAGESLLFDLRRMEAQYLAENRRERELTKHVSLALTQPLALVQLIETGTCYFSLDEALFDHDHPGHYFRRLRSVALTVPCVTGPYTGVNATLTLNTAIIRTSTNLQGKPYASVTSSSSSLDPAIFNVTNPGTAIDTSSGQNDAGLFDVNLRDERWLPFEGQGAISSFTLELNPQDNDLDFSTITDVVVHVRYTARPGIDPQTVRDAINKPPIGPRSILVSVRHSFGSAYYSFLNPTDAAANQQTLTLPITDALFPFSNLGSSLKITDIGIYLVYAPALYTGTPIGAPGTPNPPTFGPTGGTQTSISLSPVVGTDAFGNPIPVLSNWPSPPPPFPSPQLAFPVESLTLTVPFASGKMQLDSTNLEDIVLIIQYAID